MVWKGEISFAGEQSGLDEGAEVPAERFSQPWRPVDWSNEGPGKKRRRAAFDARQPTKAPLGASGRRRR